MRSKKTFSFYSVLAVTLVALGVFSTLMVRSLWYYPQEEMAVPLTSQNNTAKDPESKILSDPLRLEIPALKIDAKIQKVGITTKGNMAAPTNFKDVGWYKYGSLPGEAGNAIMAGHVDNGIAFPGVFKHLGELKKGDDIYVKMSDEEIIHYVVTGSAIYDYDDKLESIISPENVHSLKLITCTGRILLSKRTHASRLVVTAVEEKV